VPHGTTTFGLAWLCRARKHDRVLTAPLEASAWTRFGAEMSSLWSDVPAPKIPTLLRTNLKHHRFAMYKESIDHAKVVQKRVQPASCPHRAQVNGL